MKQLLYVLAAAALAAPVSAAEVGVRHTWGHSTTNTHSGRSITRSESHGAYIERSWGRSGGGRNIGSTESGGGSGYIRGEIGGFSTSSRESFGFNGTSTSGFSETSTFSR